MSLIDVFFVIFCFFVVENGGDNEDNEDDEDGCLFIKIIAIKGLFFAYLFVIFSD